MEVKEDKSWLHYLQIPLYETMGINPGIKFHGYVFNLTVDPKKHFILFQFDEYGLTLDPKKSTLDPDNLC